MLLVNIVKYKFKMAVRSKELYVYIIGFPLIFMLIYGSLASSTFSSVEPITIGFLNEDTATNFKIGNTTYTINYGLEYYHYLQDLKYENTNVHVFKIINITDQEEAEKKASRLEIAAAIRIKPNFSESILNVSKSMTYLTLVGPLTYEMNKAYEQGDYDLANRYLSALIEISEFANITYKIEIGIIGDPTYSKAMQAYELTWKYMINYVFNVANGYTEKYKNYLSEKYEIEVPVNDTNNKTFTQSFNVEFVRIGGSEGIKESFMQMYFSILVPGQVIQSIMIAAVSVIYMVGHEISQGLLERLKLTKVRSSEYIGGTLLAWGIVSLFQAAILLLIATGLGYVKVIGTPMHYLLSILILSLAGILTAAFSLIIVSFVRENIAGTIAMISLITISLFIAGYFPVSNPVIGQILGREFTLLDLVPWRSAITALRKSLVLVNIYSPVDVVPDLLLLALWTAIYTTIAFVTFSVAKLRKRL